MKKIVLSTAIYLLVSLFTSSLRAGNGSIADDSKKVILDLSYMSGEEVKCQIVDEKGFIIFSEKFELGQKVFKSFNLSQLGEGSYDLILRDKIQVVNYDIKIDAENIALIDNKKITYKPTVRLLENNKLDFDLLSLGKDVKVELQGKKGDVIYNKNYKKQSVISKRLNLQKVERGEYTVKVTVGDKVFYEFLRI